MFSFNVKVPFRYKPIIYIMFYLPLSFCICTWVYPQSKVRQGTVEDLYSPFYSTGYMSPIVFEYDLSKLKYVPIKKKKSQFLVVDDFNEYECDKVVLKKLQIARRETEETDKRELVIKAHLFTKPPKDKYVTLRFNLLVDNKSIAGNIVRNISVEEGYHITVDTLLLYSKGLFEMSPAPVLEIVMSVKDDNL